MTTEVKRRGRPKAQSGVTAEDLKALEERLASQIAAAVKGAAVQQPTGMPVYQKPEERLQEAEALRPSIPGVSPGQGIAGTLATGFYRRINMPAPVFLPQTANRPADLVRYKENTEKAATIRLSWALEAKRVIARRELRKSLEKLTKEERDSLQTAFSEADREAAMRPMPVGVVTGGDPNQKTRTWKYRVRFQGLGDDGCKAEELVRVQ